RAGPRTEHGRAREGGAAGGGGRHRARLRAPGSRTVPQQRRDDRRRWAGGGRVPQDAHPGRPGLLREILFRARRPRVSRVRHGRGTNRDARVLGPVVSRGSSPHRAAGREYPLLPDGDRLAPAGKGGARRRAARRLAHHSARPRDCEWLLRGRGEPGRTRGPGRRERRWNRVLGLLVPRRSVRRDPRGGPGGPRSDRRGGGGSRAHRGSPPRLAVPAGPPDRRLRRDHEPVPRRPLVVAETPAGLGFRVPAEWEPHHATWIGWARNASAWPGKFRFNAWAKYSDWKLDDRVAERVASRLKLRLFRTEPREFVLEGGSIDVNGRGTLLTTEECLLDPVVQVRNPGFGRAEIEAVLKDQLGVANILWLGKGIVGDDTHGHVDDLCRFVDPRTVVLCRETDVKDANYRALAENRERLAGMRLEDGSKIEVVNLPMPGPVYFDGQRLPARIATFYIADAAVLVPTFNDPKDRTAL